MTNHKLGSSDKGKQPRFYYGWIVVLAAFLIMIIAGGAQYSFGVFLKPILNEFGWSRAATAGAYSLNMALMGASGILAGRMNDKFGPRLVLTVCGIMVGAGYLLMSHVSAIWQIYVFFGVMISIGMSCTTVPLMSTVARWFVKRRGLASGMVASGVGVGITVAPPLANLLITTTSWQKSYTVIGAIALVTIVVLAQFLKRDPGQSSQSTLPANAAPISQVHGLSIREALRTAPFWIICAMSLFFVFGQ